MLPHVVPQRPKIKPKKHVSCTLLHHILHHTNTVPESFAKLKVVLADAVKKTRFMITLYNIKMQAKKMHLLSYAITKLVLSLTAHKRKDNI